MVLAAPALENPPIRPLAEVIPVQLKGTPTIQKDVKKILLIQLGDIGDVVLTLPCLRALRESFPDAALIAAVRDKARELVVDCPWADDVISVSETRRPLLEGLHHQARFFKRLRQYRFDLSINLRTGDRSAILSFLVGARQRISFYAHDGQLWQNRAFTHLNLIDYEVGQYVADYYSSLLGAYNIRTQHNVPQMNVPSEKLKKVQELFFEKHIPGNRPIIALQPFSIWQYKEWGNTKYIQLIHHITSKYGLPVIITGSPDERTRASALAADCGPRAFNLAGKTTIGVFAALLKSCGLFIGVDSAGMHIAAAVGTPTVCIFGPSSAASWAPRGPQHKIVHSNLPCVPCRQKGCEGTEQSRCLDGLSVDEVIGAVDAQIEEFLP
jgi:predicted lipopolysaccharide heptosyltransferase III